MKTIFEKIISGEITADILHEDESCIVIRDIDPQAPTHCLIIPKNKIERIAEADYSDRETLGHLLFIAQQTAEKLNLDNGFRIVINNGTEGGESVPHLHIHLLGGRQIKWPPG